MASQKTRERTQLPCGCIFYGPLLYESCGELKMLRSALQAAKQVEERAGKNAQKRVVADRLVTSARDRIQQHMHPMN